MDGFELNKIFGALIAAGLTVMAIGVISDIVYHVEEPDARGFQVAVATDDGDVEEVVEEEMVSVLDLLATADIAAGERAARRCASCHTFEEGGANGVGPNLWDVVARAKGSVAEFAGYSGALQEVAAAGEVWGYEELDGFIASPRDYMPGTTMGFAGIRDAEDRADLILYMRSLSGNPAPLPE